MICYTEPNSFATVEAWRACDREHCRTMPIVSPFYGTNDPDGTNWRDNGEAVNKYWQEHFERVRDLWFMQGMDDRLGLGMTWFADKRLPPGTTEQFCDWLAINFDMLFKGNRSGKIGLLFSNNEDWSVPSAAIDRAWSNLRTMCSDRTAWNRASGFSWWGEFARPAAGRPCGQGYHITTARDAAVASRTIEYNGPRFILWTPCHKRRDAAGKWAIVPENEANLWLERMVFRAMARGCRTFGLHLPDIQTPDGRPDLDRQQRTLDFIDQTLALGESMYGRAA